MKILAFETSAKAASVALLEEGKLPGLRLPEHRTHPQPDPDGHGSGPAESAVPDTGGCGYPGRGRGPRLLYRGPHRRGCRQGLCLGPGDPVLRRQHPGRDGGGAGGLAGLCVPGDGCPAQPGLQRPVPRLPWEIATGSGRTGPFPWRIWARS